MNSKARELTPVLTQFAGPYPGGDEVSLVDLWITLLRFKKIFLSTLIAVLVAGGLLVGFALGDKYTISSIIHIGTVKQDTSLVRIEEPESVVARLNLSIIPGLTRAYIDNRGMKPLRTTVTNPGDTDLVVISNVVDRTGYELVAAFQGELVDRIVADHRLLFDQLNQELRYSLAVERKKLKDLENPLKAEQLTAEMQIELAEKQQELDKLTDDDLQQTVKLGYQAEIEIVENRIQAYNRQIDAYENQLKSSTGIENRATLRANIEENHLEISSLRNRLNELQQKLDGHERDLKNRVSRQKLVVKDLKDWIKLTESDLAGQIEVQKARVQGIERELKKEGSRTSAVAELSLEPVGLSKISAILLVVIGAFTLAFLAALAAIFREKVHARIAEEGQ